MIPGSYLLEPSASPDAVDAEPFHRIVEIEPGLTATLEIDPGLRPYGEVEVSLLVNGERPFQGFGVRFQKEGREYYDYFDTRDNTPARLLLPADDGYRVIVEPLDETDDNTFHQIGHLVNVAAGQSRLDLSIETCTVTCAIGERYRDRLKGAWQLLVIDGPDGKGREPIDAADHMIFDAQPTAEYNYIDVTFRYVPVDATHLRFSLRDKGAKGKSPFLA